MTTLSLNRRERTGLIAPAIALLLVTIGPPVFLMLLVGWPVPSAHAVDEALRLHWVSHDLSLQLAASIAWLAWIYLAISVALAVVDELRHRPRPRALLPGLLDHLVQVGVAATIALLALPQRAPLEASLATVAAATFDPSPAAVASDLHTSFGIDYVVRPRDNLWDIATEHYGDPLRWRDIWHANAGRVMPDGTTFTEPGMIQPGWHLTIPRATPTQDSTRTVHPRASRPSTPHPTSTHKPITPQTTADGASASASRPTLERPASGPAGHSLWASPWAFPAGIGFGAAAVGLAQILDRRRRTAMRRRPIGARIPLPTGELAAAEHALRSESVSDDTAIVAATTRLAGIVLPRDADVAITTVCERSDGVELRFTDRVPAASPFTDTSDGWLLPNSDLAAIFAASDRAEATAALVEAGSGSGGRVYLNLEAYGALAISGDEDARQGLLETIVTQLAAAPWADLVSVHAVATNMPELAIHSERVHVVTDWESTVAGLRQIAAQTASDVEVRAASSLAALRARDPEPPAGVHVLVLTADDPMAPQAIELATDARTPVVAIIDGDIPGVPTIRVSDERLEIPGVLGPLTPKLPNVNHRELVAALIEQTDLPAVSDSAPPYDAVNANTPATSETGTVDVCVLGPPEVAGTKEPIRGLLLRMLVYLSLHRDGVDPEKLAAALWGEKGGPAKTVRNRIHELRLLIGGGISDGRDPEHLRWRLDDTVTTDWARFQALAKGDLGERRQALALVRGTPLDGVRGEWVSVEGYRTAMESSIVDVAVSVGKELLAAGDHDGADHAARLGIRACPYEERLYHLAMRAAAARGATNDILRLQDDLTRALELQDGDEISLETAELVRRLLGKAKVRQAG